MTWDERFLKYLVYRDNPGPGAQLLLEEARKAVNKNTESDWQWLMDSLSNTNRQKRFFVASMFKSQPVPKMLFEAMLLAGVVETDPSANRVFIEPCVRSWGALRVLERLLKYLRDGSNPEKAGAASAIYWVHGNPRNEDLGNLKKAIRSQFLLEFVHNKDVAVRRRIIPMLRLDEASYPEELRPLVSTAIGSARADVDEYVRHRVEIQLGAGGPFKAIPTS